MRYQFKTGQHERQIVQQSVARGLPVPENIANAPELRPWLELYWRCYFDMRRGIDKHTNIAWRDVQYWCDTYELPTTMAVAAHDAVVALDLVWAELNPKAKPGGK